VHKKTPKKGVILLFITPCQSRDSTTWLFRTRLQRATHNIGRFRHLTIRHK